MNDEPIPGLNGLARTFGKPYLFITFTCNPRWDEIQSALIPGEAASDRPDLCARVFNIKLKSLLADVVKREVFGKVVSWCYTIEFQKRGLPHAHSLFTLDPADCFRDAAMVDEAISAEIPDPAEDELLYQTVCENMLHGSCGSQNPNAPCMVNGVCQKHFPMSFADETVLEEGRTPRHRRRNNGRVFIRNQVALHNGHVVTYSPYLCRRYRAHINVVLSGNIHVFKYIYKSLISNTYS